jgi:hypothetical protein
MSPSISRATSPTSFIVEDYAPGLSIDFRSPAQVTDLDQIREGMELESWRELPFAALMQRADRACCELQASETEGDFIQSVRRFGGGDDLERSLAVAARMLTSVGHEASPFEQVRALLLVTGILRRTQHFAVSLVCHTPGRTTELLDGGTHFGYVLDGDPLELELPDGRRYPLYARAYFCVPGRAALRGAGRVEIITRHGYQGMLVIGGRVEPWGRLRYIDGCTDTVLVPPVRRGDPCLNALYFPPHTRQTQHVHPSLRAGVVIAGAGTCKTPGGGPRALAWPDLLAPARDLARVPHRAGLG